MRYDATSEVVAGEQYATVQATRPASEALALRHASAVRAVLLAARAWKEARGLLDEFRFADAERRLCAAQERLAKIEREVSRG